MEHERDLKLVTDRLSLVAATDRSARAAVTDARELGRLLDAKVPPSWPPPLMDDGPLQFTAGALEAQPWLAGWLFWYWIRHQDRVLIGAGGFKGWPNERGCVEIGYTIFPEFHGAGFATEAVACLIEWAFAHEQVSSIAAETYPELAASIRVMEKNGFSFIGAGSEPRVIRYELARHVWAAARQSMRVP